MLILEANALRFPSRLLYMDDENVKEVVGKPSTFVSFTL